MHHVYCYLIQDGRLPPVYFAPFQFGKDAFQKIKEFFFKKTVSSSHFLVFPTLKIFWKNLTISVEKAFLRNSTIWYAFYKKCATFSEFEENQGFFWKKKRLFFFFQKQPKFRLFWEIILSQSHFTAIFLHFDGKKSPSEMWTILPMFAFNAWTQSTDIGIKNAPIWVYDFAPILYNMVRNNK